MSINIKRLMNIISTRTVSFFNDELGIQIDGQDIQLVTNNRIELKHITSLVSIGVTPHIFVIFSYEDALMNKIFEAYTKELDILADERIEYIEETAGDVVNIIVGNSIAECHDGTAIPLSTPIVISSAESIAKSRNVKFFVNDLNSVDGNMRIFCVGPNELFEV